MTPKISAELVVFVLTIRVCAGWSFKVHLWNNAHDDVYLNLHNLRIESCLNECVLRPWCVAVQYHIIRRSCGKLQLNFDISKLMGLFFTSSNYPKCK